MIEKKNVVTNFDDLVSKTGWADPKCIYRHMVAKPKEPKDVNPSGLAETAADIFLQARIWNAAPHVNYQTAIDLLLLINARDEAQNKIDNARGMRGWHMKKLFATSKLIPKNKTPIRENFDPMQQFLTRFDM